MVNICYNILVISKLSDGRDNKKKKIMLNNIYHQGKVKTDLKVFLITYINYKSVQQDIKVEDEQ